MSKLDEALKGFARFELRQMWGYPHMSRSTHGDYVKARRAAQEVNRLRSEVSWLRAEVEQLGSERRMLVSHATMGGTDGTGLSVNEISCRVTALRNALYERGKDECEALRAEVAQLRKERLADLARLNEDAKVMEQAALEIRSLRAAVAALKGGAK